VWEIFLYNAPTWAPEEDSVKTDLTEEMQQVMTETLTAAGFASPSEAALALSLTIALAKVSRYEREAQHFRHKYGDMLEVVRARVEHATGTEDFAVEDDLADWEFAERGLALWQKRVEILRHAMA
jgi:hypothetical protein